MEKIITCESCGFPKVESDFAKRSDTGQKRKQCKDCYNAKRRPSRNQYRAENVEEARAKANDWCKNNPDKRKAQSKRHREKHAQKLMLWQRLYRLLFPEKPKQVCKNWREKYPEKKKRIDKLRAYRERGAEGSYTLKEWIELCVKHGNKCLRCGKKEKLTVDHVIPISKGGTNYIDNLQPLCFSCNSAKKDRIEDYRV